MRAYIYFSIIVPQLWKTSTRSSETLLPTYYILLPENESNMGLWQVGEHPGLFLLAFKILTLNIWHLGVRGF